MKGLTTNLSVYNECMKKKKFYKELEKHKDKEEKNKELDPFLQELVDEMWSLVAVMEKYIERMAREKKIERKGKET